MSVLRQSTQSDENEQFLRRKIVGGAPHTLTPFIVTMSEGTLTDIDIGNLLEIGVRVVRFKISHIARADKVLLLSHLHKAIAYCTEKHEHTSLPVAISVDLPNAAILTGYLKDDIVKNRIMLHENTMVKVTSDFQYWNKCDENRIFIDDAFTLSAVKPGTEISIDFGEIILICKEVVNAKCMKCKVKQGGYLESAQFVCIRGVKFMRPSLSKLDRRLLEFAKDNELDVIIINFIRDPITVKRVRAFFEGAPVKPFIICTICEQEGLDRLDEILDVTDGIILAREFLAHTLINPYKLPAIQMYISAKCRVRNKPLYLSGSVLENTLKYGITSCSEISDVVNAAMSGAGFVLRCYSSPASIIASLELMNRLCRGIETIAMNDEYWPMCLQAKQPVTAAHGVILSCAMAAKMTGSNVIIVLTVTGLSAIKLAQMSPQSVILAVTANLAVARQLNLYRGILPIVYLKPEQELDWYHDMIERIQFAVRYGLKHDLLFYNEVYVVLRKGTTSSAFCDQISMWKVIIEQSKKRKITCPTSSNHPSVHQQGHPY